MCHELVAVKLIKNNSFPFVIVNFCSAILGEVKVLLVNVSVDTKDTKVESSTSR